MVLEIFEMTKMSGECLKRPKRKSIRRRWTEMMFLSNGDMSKNVCFFCTKTLQKHEYTTIDKVQSKKIWPTFVSWPFLTKFDVGGSFQGFVSTHPGMIQSSHFQDGWSNIYCWPHISESTKCCLKITDHWNLMQTIHIVEISNYMCTM